MTLNGKIATRYKDFHEAKPCYVKHLRIWGEAGTMSMGKMGKGKQRNSYDFYQLSKNCTGDCYCMYNPNTRYVTEMRDIMWLHHMYNGKPEARDEVVVYLQVALPFKPEDVVARKGVTLNASEPKLESKDNKKEWSTVHMRSGRVAKPPVLYMTEYSTDGLEGAYHTPKLLCSIVQAKWQRNKEHINFSCKSLTRWWIWSY